MKEERGNIKEERGNIKEEEEESITVGMIL